MNIFKSISLLYRARIGAHLDPVRDWFVLLILSSFVFIIVIIWNIWAFDIVIRGGVIGSNVTNVTPVLNNFSINAIHTIFEKRADEEAKYRSGVYRYADPSQ